MFNIVWPCQLIVLLESKSMPIWPSHNKRLFHATNIISETCGPYYSIYGWYIHQTCTNCSSWHDLLIPHDSLYPWPTFHAWVTMLRKKWLSPKCGCPYSDRSVHPVRKKCLSPFYSTYWWYIHQICTNCSSWHDLLISHGGLCPWPSLHAWVTMVRNKWLSPYYSTNWCYIHQNCANCSSWHDLLIPRSGLCPWPVFYAWVTMVRKKWFRLYYSTYECYIHQTCINCLSWHVLLIPRGGLRPWPSFHASVIMVRKK